jgi:hypothetical protein
MAEANPITGSDIRHPESGREIPSEGYCDQPYIVRTDDDAWLCVMTTGAGNEGQSGQHVVALRSEDRGRTWSAAVPLEPSSGPEASYAVLLKVPSGRVYAFYNHNTDNVTQVKGDPAVYRDRFCRRVDSLGHFVLKYSDDHGRTWSQRRYDIPQRLMAIDRENADHGELLYFWNVGKAFYLDGAGYVSLHKVGGFGEGFFTRSEGVLLRSSNILSEMEPEKLRWETLPEGENGLGTPDGGGPVAEEQSYVTLSDGSIYCVYRTIDGYPVCTYSRDGGRTWEPPEYKRYAGGRLMKHPRAANFVWRCDNGKFLYWFHNHGGRFIGEHPGRRSMAYLDRNPVWLCGGVEVQGARGKRISWSQPEIALYDDDPYVRMSYPDLIEEGGELFISETQKEVARVHSIDPALLRALWTQHETCATVQGALLEEQSAQLAGTIQMPRLPALNRRDPRPPYGTEDLRAGFAIELWLVADPTGAGQVLLDSRSADGRGLLVRALDDAALEIRVSDGRTECSWSSDAAMIVPGQPGHVVINVDGGPKIISFVVNGQLCDGGDQRQFGWGRFSRDLRDANGSGTARLGTAVRTVRVYGRCLMTSEAIGSYRAGQS